MNLRFVCISAPVLVHGFILPECKYLCFCLLDTGESESTWIQSEAKSNRSLNTNVNGSQSQSCQLCACVKKKIEYLQFIVVKISADVTFVFCFKRHIA